MSHRTVRSVVAGAASAALLLPVAGCGGGEDSPSASGSPSASASPSDSASESASGDVDPQELLDAMKAAYDDNRTVHFTMRTAKVLSAEGSLAYVDDGVSMDMTMSMPSAGMRDLRMLLVDGRAYLSIPGQTPKGKLMVVDSTVPGMKDLLSQTENMGPQGTFDAFEAGLEKVELVGEEQAGGEQLRHYRLTVDTQAAMKAQGTDPQAAAGLPATLTYDMWLDEEDLMRKIVFELAGSTTTMTMDRWGEDVEIRRPDPAEVVRMQAAG